MGKAKLTILSNRKPTLLWLDIDSLETTNISYQRNINQARVNRIVESWCWPKAHGIVITIFNNKYRVADGQHIVSAAKIINNNAELKKKYNFDGRLPCLVFDVIDIAEEAAIFEGQNDHKVVTLRGKFNSRLKRGEYVAIIIDRAIRRAGAVITDSQHQENPGAPMVTSVEALDRIYHKTPDEDFLYTVASTLLSIFPKEKHVLSSGMLMGMATLLKSTEKQIKIKKLVERLHKTGYDEIKGSGNKHKALLGGGNNNLGKAYALAMIHCYNRGAKGNYINADTVNWVTYGYIAKP